MKVMIEESGVTCTVEDDSEENTVIHAAEMCRLALMGAGYSEKCVAEVMGES